MAARPGIRRGADFSEVLAAVVSGSATSDTGRVEVMLNDHNGSRTQESTTSTTDATTAIVTPTITRNRRLLGDTGRASDTALPTVPSSRRVLSRTSLVTSG
jgi:hypothetical protein